MPTDARFCFGFNSRQYILSFIFTEKIFLNLIILPVGVDSIETKELQVLKFLIYCNPFKGI